MRVSDKCFNKIKEFEGLRLISYKCPAGVWTIGYGHTNGVKPGMTITTQQADTLLRGDLLPFETYVRNLELDLTQGQFDALVDFCFNLGTGSLGKSTLLQKVKLYCKTKDESLVKVIKEEFAKWVYAGNIKFSGLVKRRDWEAERFFE